MRQAFDLDVLRRPRSAGRPIQSDHSHILGHDDRTMAEASSALCQGGDRPGARPVLTENGFQVIDALAGLAFAAII